MVYSDPAVTQSETLPQVLLARALSEPGGLAERHKRLGIWREFTWANVLERVRALALGLESKGLKAGDSVMLIGENEPEHFWAEYAVQSLGGKVLSVYPDQTAEEILYLAQDSQTRIFLAQDQEQVDKCLEVADEYDGAIAIVYWDGSGLWGYDHPLLDSFESVSDAGRQIHDSDPTRFEEHVKRGKAEDTALLSYTSGTTGKPKGVVISYRYLFDNCSRVMGAIDIAPGTEYLTYISPAWVTEQIFGLSIGLIAPMVVNFPEGPEDVLTNIRELAVDALVFSPRQWENLASIVQARMLGAGKVRNAMYDWGMKVGRAVHVERLEGRTPSLAARLQLPLAEALVLHHLRDNLGLGKARNALSGGALMAPDVFRMFHAMGVKLRNVYGATEIGLLTAHVGDSYQLETSGSWMPSNTAYGEPLEYRVSPEGELQVRGGSGFGGYHGKPDKSAEALTDDGWYETGDAVSMTNDGELLFFDRVKDMRRLANGHSYPPQFIETRLRYSPFIKDLMTLGDETRDFVSALINIDMEVLGRWAEENKISFSTYTDLSQKPEILDLIKGEVARINTLLPEGSRVARFANFPKELDPDEGELTRSRKLRRAFLEERYEKLVQAIYDGKAETDLEIAVTYQDGRQGVLKATVRVSDVENASKAAGRQSQT
ncbi:AMP-binding protein [Sulfitobacter pseudonitzschiae]|uniref:AMP-binding protein n=2 Tax=Pseudosulfitobacter pseudonitzschiae TaxID=1402135 RepID=A0A073IY34_9RHOB|nr:AMP-binding protein [Pseudosulfitobacter pseudonitzschiae]KEJ94376.1 acyl-CoA synthetase [Pseudosulfitobacter pseudonitzschiae]MBM1816877.1 AMP-binding protein [Pseudosulfitobacter pseudonitzschiae]MBM1833890.1 AMP-binding protein [Pseudosulfitobacter pseudonitzschiae]MBM1838756.1 AMP-binding protein [Pseudosulfitobacter pseudonitzschiae]MBM1843605.1 AMP-binding protein [Pseudosulfitobacter pseudonitzschiae]